jgi:hypothetical protein
MHAPPEPPNAHEGFDAPIVRGPIVAETICSSPGRCSNDSHDVRSHGKVVTSEQLAPEYAESNRTISMILSMPIARTHPYQECTVATEQGLSV